jgi:hypothetical protein
MHPYDDVMYWRDRFEREMAGLRGEQVKVNPIPDPGELSAEDCVLLWSMAIGTGE